MENALLGYLIEFSKSLFAIVATLLPIMNPPSGAAMFLSATDGASAKTRHMLAKNIARYCFLMLICFILLGSFVLKFFGISPEIVLIGGGLLVVKMGWGLVTADHATPKHDEQLADAKSPENIMHTAFFPLSFPLTVGPGVLATSLTLGVSFMGPATSFSLLVARLLGGLVGIIILALIIRVSYGYAEKLMSKLGETGAVVFLRLCAFILLCIGIQLIWNGLSSSITNLYHSLATTPAAQVAPAESHPLFPESFFDMLGAESRTPTGAGSDAQNAVGDGVGAADTDTDASTLEPDAAPDEASADMLPPANATGAQVPRR